MKKLLPLAALVALPAFAENSTSFGLSSLNHSYQNIDANFIAAQGSFIFNVDGNFDAGVAAVFGIEDYSASYWYQDVYIDADLKLDASFQLFMRYSAPITERTKPYIKLGWQKSSWSYNANGFKGTAKEDDIMYGVGIKHNGIDKKIAMFAEYMTYYNDEGEDVSGLTVGLEVPF